MRVAIDIETVPCADKQPFLEDARANFKAPSGMTKEKACAELNMSANAIAANNKDACINMWEKHFSEIKSPEVAEEAWRKTALDGTKGRILSIAWKIPETGATGLHISDPVNERENLQLFIDTLTKAISAHGSARPPFFIGHNVTFDLKFLFRRCVILGVRPPFAFPFRGRHDVDYFCTMEAWCDFGERISLANLCAALNIEPNNDMDGSMVCDYWLQGRYAELGAYNQDDVEETIKVYNALKFITPE